LKARSLGNLALGKIMSYQSFNVSIEANIAHIQLSRPEKRNSMTPEFWDELPQIVADIDDNSRARVIGGDEAQQADPDHKLTRGESFYRTVKRMQHTFNCLEDCRLPVLVAIQGGCIGGGMDFVTACDIRYATADAFFTVYEVKIGMTADVGTFPRLVKLIPEGIVRELAYTGRRMSAAEAHQAGLVNQVFADHEGLLAAVMEVAAEIASNAPLAVYGSKRMINYARDHSTADSLDYVGIWNASFLQPAEMMEAITANGERRPGKFASLPKKGR
jgi:enoyl-CoA hydratase